MRGGPRAGAYDSRRIGPYSGARGGHDQKESSWNDRKNYQSSDRIRGEPSWRDELREKEEAPRKQAQTTNIQRNMQTSGVLAEETNMKNGILLKHTLPLDARKPSLKWWLFVFSNKSSMDGKTLTLGDSNCYLFGNDARVADVPIMHPTTSKQHAVICFRWNSKKAEACPYLMDLNSTNGTFLNHEQIESTRYYELLAGDMIRFARSSRDYVIMRDEQEDDDEDGSSFDEEGDDVSESNLPAPESTKTAETSNEDKVLADLVQAELAKERARRKAARNAYM